MVKIEKSEISTPSLFWTKKALNQILLIITNDFTLKNKTIRILITGKDCDGFQYSIGFSEENANDFKVNLSETGEDFVSIDPFTAFYLKRAHIDFLQDHTSNEEGFVIKNVDQKKYSGKFWKKDIEKIPPIIK